MSGQGGNPFSLRAALLLVLGGAALFVALLAMIGAGSARQAPMTAAVTARARGSTALPGSPG